ncbi:hypothetical protein B0J14DRAFT_645188 [Halenospora varia]|nr:hypothetical protein B0J14DRAFT_645188 [Halenospora varia]
MHNLHSWPLCIQLNPLRIQVATLVHVTTIQQSDPNQLFAVRVTHQHPSAHHTGKKTYDIDVLLAKDDDTADMCWRFQIAEGEDLLDRLLAYAHAFGKHGWGDENYDEYVHAFQGKITGLAVSRICDKEGWVIRDEDEDEDEDVEVEEVEEDVVSPGFAEKARVGNGIDEEGRNKGKK